MAAGPTYTTIETQTISGTSTSSITLGSGNTLPQTYTDLVLICTGALTAGGDVGVRFNGDSAGNYSFIYIRGNGSSASSSQSWGQTYSYLEWVGFGTSENGTITNIQNYTDAINYKTSLSKLNQAGVAVDTMVTLWYGSPAPITQMSVHSIGANFANGFTISLYGIAAA